MLLFSDIIITGSLRSSLFDKIQFDCGPEIFGGGTSYRTFVKISFNGETFKFGGEVALFPICLLVSRSCPFVKCIKKYCFFICCFPQIRINEGTLLTFKRFYFIGMFI